MPDLDLGMVVLMVYLSVIAVGCLLMEIGDYIDRRRLDQ